MGLGFALAIFASLFWGASDFLGGVKTRSVALVTVLAISQIAGLLGIMTISLLRAHPFPLDNRIIFAPAAGAASLVALGSIYYATAIGPIIVVAPVAALGAALPVTVGILRGNSVGLMAILGMVFALCGVTIVGWEAGESRVRSRGLIAPALALISALATGVFFIFLNEASTPDPYWATVVMRATSCFLVLGFIIIRRPRDASVRSLGVLTILALAAVGLTDMGAEVCFATASGMGQLSIISVLASLYPVVTVLLAMVLLRERAHWIQLCGAAATVTGAVLLAGASP